MEREQGRPDPGQEPGALPAALPSPLPSAEGPRRLVDGLDTPRLSALDGLLRDLDALRRSVETDLTLVAAAVDADEAALAGALVQADRDALAAFEVRALAHLRALARADAESPAAPVPALHPLPVVGRRRRRPLRVARLLPAAPLVAAAAALVGLLGIPQTAARPAPPQAPGAVLSSWEELARLSAQDAPPDQVRQAAMDLNADLASMVARAGDDPAVARQALALLQEAQAVLTADDDAPELTAALTQARQLAARLLASLPPSARPGPVVLPAVVVPALPSPRQDQQRPRPQRAARASQQAEPRPGQVPTRPAAQKQPSRAPRADRTPHAAPSPSSGAAASASPTAPSSRPSGRPAPTPPPVLPASLDDPL